MDFPARLALVNSGIALGLCAKKRILDARFRMKERKKYGQKGAPQALPVQKR